MYVEWCPHGDLHSIFNKYITHDEAIPEPFLWCLLECLADCAEAMADGDVDDGRRAPEWMEIVHRDIKPANIFLGDPDPARYPQYPRPLLADFGLAFKTRPNDATTPTLWQNSGTTGFMAPEQIPYFDRATGKGIDIVPLSSATNIYAIGAVVALLMKRPQRNIEQPIWLGDGRPENTLYTHQVPDDDDEGEEGVGMGDGGYSRELKRIVNRCLSFRPEERPDAEELRRVVRDAVNESRQPREDGTVGLDLAKGMRSGWAARGVGKGARKYAVFLEPDSYQLHFAKDQLPEQML